MVSADGLDVRPVSVTKLLHAIAETYDFILEWPEGKSVEFQAVAQDGSGRVSAVIGKGKVMKAPPVPKPDLIQQMKEHHQNGHHIPREAHQKDSSEQVHQQQHHAPREAHQKDSSKQVHQQQHHAPREAHQKDSSEQVHQQQHHAPREAHQTDHLKRGQGHQKTFHYNDLKSIHKTSFSTDRSVREISFDLKGNMRRYVWNINGKTLSESDKIKIKQGEVLRITLNNTTMMHHPMHLHGHFFRVLNASGEYSPLKHTVDVPPMGKAVIEFEPHEKGDWFFHCHILYHMKQGMSRVFAYKSDKRDTRLNNYSLSSMWNADRSWFKWGLWSLMSNRFDTEFVVANTRNQFDLGGTFSWVDQQYNLHNYFEIKSSYQRFITDFFRLYVAMEVKSPDGFVWPNIQNTNLAAKLGFQYLLPYLLDLTLSIDQKARLQVALEYELLLFPRWEFFTEGSWSIHLQETFFPAQNGEWQEYEWSLGMNYIIDKNWSLTSSYDSHFSWGVGVQSQF